MRNSRQVLQPAAHLAVSKPHFHPSLSFLWDMQRPPIRHPPLPDVDVDVDIAARIPVVAITASSQTLETASRYSVYVPTYLVQSR